MSGPGLCWLSSASGDMCFCCCSLSSSPPPIAPPLHLVPRLELLLLLLNLQGSVPPPTLPAWVFVRVLCFGSCCCCLRCEREHWDPNSAWNRDTLNKPLLTHSFKPRLSPHLSLVCSRSQQFQPESVLTQISFETHA